MSEQLELYVYTTKTWQKQGLLKIGHALKGRTTQRIKEQFNASNPESPITLWTQDLPSGKKDHHIHQQLKSNGLQQKTGGAGQEWFYASLDDVKEAFNQVIHGSNRINNFELRSEQKQAVKKATKWFEIKDHDPIKDSATHKNRFLLNAKMRFGKCFTSIHIAKAIQAQKTIVVTYKPRVIDEWMEAVNKHIDFKDWTGIRAKQADNINEPYLNPPENNLSAFQKPFVLCVSLQDLNIDENGSVKDRLEQVLETPWDLLIFDEVHFGGQTNRVQNILKYLNPKYRLDLSGTPFRLIGAEDFCPEQVFTYSYIDEQKNKQEEIKDGDNARFVYRKMPDLHISTIEITKQDIKEQKEKFIKTDDLDFSLNELFKANSNGFVHNDAVDHFLRSLSNTGYDSTALSVYGKLGSQLNLRETRHSVWWLSRIQSIKHLIKKLKSHPIFSRYQIINASGGQKGDDLSGEDLSDEICVKSKDEIIDKIKKVESGKINRAGTITLTCRKFLTGVTIEQWDSILILNDIESAESYFQAIFRIQSAWFDQEKNQILKPIGYVFDFAISRCLRTTYQYADALADQLDQQDSHNHIRLLNDNLTAITDGLCDKLNIKRFYEGRFDPDNVSSDAVFEAVASFGSKVALAKRITSESLVSFEALRYLENNSDLFEALKNVKGYRTQDVGSVDEFVQIGDEAKQKRLAKERLDPGEKEIEKENDDFVKKERDRKKQSRKKWYATQIKRLAICMADFIYMTKFREYKIDHVIETRDSEFFKIVTGIGKDDFFKLCDKGFINKEALNRIVREFRYQEETSLKPEEYIFEYLKSQAS